MPEINCCKVAKVGTINWIGCDATDAEKLCPGKGWFHIECVGIQKSEMNNIKTFICNMCAIRTGQKTEYYLNERNQNTTDTQTENESTDTQEDEEDSSDTSMEIVEENEENIEPNQEFVVKAIKNHAIDTSPTGEKNMMFLIEWEGYPNADQFTWEYETNLVKCYDLVKKYREENRLKRTTLKPIGGADQAIYKDRVNPDNWVDLERIRQTAKQFLGHQNFDTNLSLITCHSADFKKPKKDSVIILLHASHYYSLLWTKGAKLICDGANISSENEVKEELESILKSELQVLKVDKKIKLDHCGGAAVLAILEFARGYKIKDITFRNITFPPFYFDRVINTLYQGASEPEPGRKKIIGLSRSLKCDRCGVFSTTKGRGAMLSHQRQKCTGRQ